MGFGRGHTEVHRGCLRGQVVGVFEACHRTFLEVLRKDLCQV